MQLAPSHLWKVRVSNLPHHRMHDAIDHVAVGHVVPEESGRRQATERRDQVVVVDFVDGFEKGVRSRLRRYCNEF